MKKRNKLAALAAVGLAVTAFAACGDDDDDDDDTTDTTLSVDDTGVSVTDDVTTETT